MNRKFFPLLFMIVIGTIIATQCRAQVDSVVWVQNATVRNLIEQFTIQYTVPDGIVFVQDANGKWITGKQNLKNIRYVATRAELKQFLQANGISASQLTGINSLKDAFRKWGVMIVYVPPPVEIF